MKKLLGGFLSGRDKGLAGRLIRGLAGGFSILRRLSKLRGFSKLGGEFIYKRRNFKGGIKYKSTPI